MSSKWVEHVKEFASKKEMKYGEAMRNEECRKSYQETKQSIPLEKMKEISTEAKEERRSEAKKEMTEKSIPEKKMKTKTKIIKKI